MDNIPLNGLETECMYVSIYVRKMVRICTTYVVVLQWLAQMYIIPHDWVLNGLETKQLGASVRMKQLRTHD